MAITTGSTHRTIAQSTTDWNAILQAAYSGVAVINDWLNMAKIDGGIINEGVGMLTRGALRSDFQTFSASIKAAIASQGVAEEIARAIAMEIADAWKDWAANWEHHMVLGFPGFLACITVYALPASTTPPILFLNLSSGYSRAEYRLYQQELNRRLLASLPNPDNSTQQSRSGSATSGGSLGVQSLQSQTVAHPLLQNGMGAASSSMPGGSTHFASVLSTNGSREAMAASLASYIDTSYRRWKMTARITNLRGEGPCPNGGRPGAAGVSAGPVVDGKLTGTLDFSAFGV